MTVRFIALIAVVIFAAGLTIWMAMVWSSRGGALWATALGPVLLAVYLVIRLRKGR